MTWSFVIVISNGVVIQRQATDHRELKQRGFWVMHGKWTFCIIELWLICLNFGQFVSMKVKTLNSSNLVTSMHFKVENGLTCVTQKCCCLRCLMPQPSPSLAPIFGPVFDSRSSIVLCSKTALKRLLHRLNDYKRAALAQVEIILYSGWVELQCCY